jgi:hypothetical protein
MEVGEMHLRLSGSQAQTPHDNSLTMKRGRSRQQAARSSAVALYGCHAGSLPRCHPLAGAGNQY